MRRCDDPESLKAMAERIEDENWRFRAFLRELDTREQQWVDKVVHQLYREESEMLDCRLCANCCKEISPLLEDEDVARISLGTGIPADRLLEEYLEKDEEWDGLMFKQAPCPFLKDNRCTCYEHRPHDCASYPHMHKKEFTHRLIGNISNTAVCPVVFNVFERLKEEMKPQGWNRHVSGRSGGRR